MRKVLEGWLFMALSFSIYLTFSMDLLLSSFCEEKQRMKE